MFIFSPLEQFEITNVIPIIGTFINSYEKMLNFFENYNKAFYHFFGIDLIFNTNSLFFENLLNFQENNSLNIYFLQFFSIFFNDFKIQYIWNINPNNSLDLTVSEYNAFDSVKKNPSNFLNYSLFFLNYLNNLMLTNIGDFFLYSVDLKDKVNTILVASHIFSRDIFSLFQISSIFKYLTNISPLLDYNVSNNSKIALYSFNNNIGDKYFFVSMNIKFFLSFIFLYQGILLLKVLSKDIIIDLKKNFININLKNSDSINMLSLVLIKYNIFINELNFFIKSISTSLFKNKAILLKKNLINIQLLKLQVTQVISYINAFTIYFLTQVHEKKMNLKYNYITKIDYFSKLQIKSFLPSNKFLNIYKYLFIGDLNFLNAEYINKYINILKFSNLFGFFLLIKKLFFFLTNAIYFIIFTFLIFPFVKLFPYSFLDFSITNITIILLLIFSLIVGLFKLIWQYNYDFIIPSRIQVIYETIFKMAYSMVKENLGKEGLNFFPLVFTLYIFIIFANLVGMVPYSYTVTSQIIITLSLSMIGFLTINIVGIKKHKINFLSLFLPSGAPIALAPLLVPLEFISYSFRVVSLAVRLFANMMAGHTLLKVIVGFSWTMLGIPGITYIAHYFPLVVILLLIGLEIGVALIQAYVFAILTCIYLSDALNLH